MTTLTWQSIDNNMERTRIPGGWLVRVMAYSWEEHSRTYSPTSVSVTYVPDFNSNWNI